MPDLLGRVYRLVATSGEQWLSLRDLALIAASGASQGEFARAVGLDDSKLSKSLGGTRRFSSLDLANIADVHQVTVDWLLTGEQPVLALAARSASGSARRAIEAADELAELCENITLVGYGQPWRPLEPDVSSGGAVEQGQALAEAALRRVREAGRNETEADLPLLVEDLLGIDVAVADLGPGCDGLSVSSQDVKLIVLATSTLPARQRLTLAHELGHLLAGDDRETLHVDPDVDGGDGARKPAEVRADAFAAAFLMPTDALVEAVGAHLDQGGLATLAGVRRVSPRVLADRLADLDLIDAAGSRGLRSMTTARAAHLGGWLHEFSRAVDAASSERTPGLLRSALYDAYDSHDTTLHPYARLLKADVDRLQESLEFDLVGA